MSGWSRLRSGTALGIAVQEKAETFAAGVAEVSVDRASGKIKVHNFWAAIDAGLAVQPRNLAAQTEGGIVWGLGHVLREKITIRNGSVQQTNYSDYQVARMSDVPSIEVKVISTDNPPTGAGEDGVPLVAGAVGNAIATLDRRAAARAAVRARTRARCAGGLSGALGLLRSPACPRSEPRHLSCRSSRAGFPRTPSPPIRPTRADTLWSPTTAS